MSQSPTRPTRVTAQQLALRHLRQLISDGVLKPDDRIRQEQLATELGCSVIPVREALKTLEAEGQIRYIPHRGYHVTRLSLAELKETYLIRRLLEDEIVRIAAPRLAEDDFEHLDRLMDAMESASSTGDVATMIESNRDLHFHIFEVAGQPRMVDFIRMLWQATDSYRALYYGDEVARDRVDHEHRSIVEALRTGDVDRAVAELERHRSHAVAALEERLAE
ncbi:GntR family transcriptional regulator [Aeromicrobium fastidiosum]|uniref:GntR family transcriptional regulator n=1 Tax=Aeromicrobium fastidiosum TaxID=52699 RepID=A0A641AN39_9ACTN|nr:GntR family transcriptional regulator [Aeromicrobium fastidiosum]KAA1378141.1 GntR family transcriptional regulator [Aeromicrobium fastidiosum]MBP2389058.1 DNA-binding GntR family transcriptional regulator [Aeromicrobium fastidiosum]